ncbi:hypothetical protein B0H12DRAFT_541016 [Mycena haematopus]|nr:hypothetical protein B0H12DRAFT_541016 [Mycena haematopus]
MQPSSVALILTAASASRAACPLWSCSCTSQRCRRPRPVPPVRRVVVPQARGTTMTRAAFSSRALVHLGCSLSVVLPSLLPFFLFSLQRSCPQARRYSLVVL